MRFEGRSVVVTGSGSGIGRVVAHRFASEGGEITVVDWKGDLAEEVAADITSKGGRAIAVAADVSVASDAERIAASASEAFGRVDVLINNAAIADGDDVLLTDEATWDRDVRVVLKGPFLCTKAILPGMIEREHGVVVNIVSVNAFSALGNEAYSAAKAGVVNLTKGVAVRYGRFGVRCVAVAPGTIRTPIWQERVDRDPQVFERLVKWYPLGRVGEPEDVSNAVTFLASEEASWITGTVLTVDGGLMAGNYPMTRELLAMASGEES